MKYAPTGQRWILAGVGLNPVDEVLLIWKGNLSGVLSYAK